MMSRLLNSLFLVCTLLVFGQSVAASSDNIDQTPSVPLAPTGTLRLQDILAHADIEVVVPSLPVPPDGPTLARQLTERFADTRQDCGANDRPAFLCSGVLFRATIPGPYHSWNPNPSNTKGTVSFSWLRRDASFLTIYTPRYSNGFIFFPNDDAVEHGYDRMDIVCVFPIDGGTDTRNNLGCGTRPEDGVHSRPCAEQGITTGAAWVTLFLQGRRYWYMCSFDVGSGTADSAAAFMQMVAAMDQIPERFQPISVSGGSFTNELLIRTWPQDIHTTLPVEAFFYQAGTANGLGNAQRDQRDFQQAADRWVPVIRMTMPATAGQDARFDYLPGEQAISPPTLHGSRPLGGHTVRLRDPRPAARGGYPHRAPHPSRQCPRHPGPVRRGVLRCR